MSMELTYAGLAAIIIGWAIQLAYGFRGGKKIQKEFVGAYALGVALLVVDGYTSGQMALAGLNALSLLVSLAVLAKVMGK